MAIKQLKTTASFDLQEEVASRVILLTRDVVDNGDKTISTNFGASIYPHWINYELDAQENRVSIYEEKDFPNVTVPLDQLMSLFGIRATLADGTVSYIGEIISNFVDQIICTSIPDPGMITTQQLNIPAILAAQAAQDLAAQQAAIAAQDAANKAINDAAAALAAQL